MVHELEDDLGKGEYVCNVMWGRKLYQWNRSVYSCSDIFFHYGFTILVVNVTALNK